MENLTYNFSKLQIEKPNLEYAKVLSNIYSGEDSIQTLFHLYFYQSLIAKDQFDEYYLVLEKVLLVEYNHFKLIGDLIKLLGLKPTFNAIINNCFIAWNVSNVDYTCELEKMIKKDIFTLKLIIQDYYEAIILIKDKYIRPILYQIIKIEEKNLKMFENFYKKRYN